MDYEDYAEVLCGVGEEFPDIDHAKDHFEALLEIIYGTRSLDHFESHLEEVAQVLGLNIPRSELKLRKDS